DRRIVVWIFLSLMLGFLNAFVKPIIAFLTLRFIFATAGLVLALINGLILALLSWLFPGLFRVDSILAGLLGGLLLGLTTAVLEALLGLNPPVVAEKYPEIRERIKDRQFYRSRMVPARIAAKSLPSAGELEGGTEVEPAALPALVPKNPEALAGVAPAAGDNKVSLASSHTEPEV
ncbi:MAG: phage holin family protein, partial [Nitrososphaerales archaeon]